MTPTERRPFQDENPARMGIMMSILVAITALLGLTAVIFGTIDEAHDIAQKAVDQ